MSNIDFENAIKGTKEYKNYRKITINFDGKIEKLDKVRNLRIANNQVYIEFESSAYKSKVEYKLKNTTVINDLKSSIYGVGDSGGCYLTTACVANRGLSDDCYELETLRKFRDDYLLSNDEYKGEVLEYYQISPEIVLKIDGDKKTLEEIYEKLILSCVSLIEQKKYDEAFNQYKEYTLQLKKQWLV